MIVHQNIRQHPKFLNLKRLVGGAAMEYLIAIWAHCQTSGRGQFWPGADEKYVELICTAQDVDCKVSSALVATGWVTPLADGIEIHDWAEHNASLVARWKRPPKTPSQPPADGSAKGSAQTSAQPCAQSTIRLDKSRVGGNNKGGAPGAAVAASKVQFAALASQISDLERIADRSSEQRAELRQKRAALRELQQKQAAGNFDA